MKIQVNTDSITAHPTGAWTSQVARNLFLRHRDQLTDAKALMRCRGSHFIDALDIFRPEDMKVLKTPLRTPVANTFAERWIGTLRRESSTTPSSGTAANSSTSSSTYLDHYNHHRSPTSNHLDVDSTICEVHGYQKQGASFGYTKVRGYHPLLATRADTGEVVHARQRKGAANTARGAKRFVEELIPRVRRAGATGQIIMRADAGFWANKTLASLESMVGASRLRASSA